MEKLRKEINPSKDQDVYFSFLRYGRILPVYSETKSFTEIDLHQDYSVVLLTGIADPSPLKGYLDGKVKEVFPISFPDHHRYSVHDIQEVRKQFDAVKNEKKPKLELRACQLILITIKEQTNFIKEPLVLR